MAVARASAQNLPKYIRTVRPHLSRTSGFMPRLLRPWAFESSTDLLLWLRTTSSSRHEGPGESRALMPFRGVAQGKMLQETREGTTDYDREGTNCETRSKLKEMTRTRNRVHRECTLS